MVENRDTLSPEERSERMGRVRNKDTKPEMWVRRLVHSLGYRYRLHYGRLPGRPDIAFPERKKVIFVHRCFWHRHEGCSRCRMLKSRQEFGPSHQMILAPFSRLCRAHSSCTLSSVIEVPPFE